MILRKLKEKLWLHYLYQVRHKGKSLFSDIRYELPNFTPRVIFDVGANIGQSARAYKRHFPSAQIHCFEPAQDTYKTLTSNLSQFGNIQCYRLALSNNSGNARLHNTGASAHFFLTTPDDENSEEVQLETIDSFCKDQQIDHIDFLKIDTEGSDFDVLEGALSMIEQKRVSMIQVECSTNKQNTTHEPLQRFQDFMESHGYLLFNFYEPKANWPTGEPFLRRVNAVFISQQLNDRNIQDVPWEEDFKV